MSPSMSAPSGRLPEPAGAAAGFLGTALASYAASIIPSTASSWRASVALVLRWTSSAPPPPSTPPANFLCNHAHDLELLLIQRAAHDGDPWSGHIGFPGGRREDGDGSDLRCAVRETWEELGIDLTEGFMYLGRLDDDYVPIGKRGKRSGVLSAFVFLEAEVESDRDMVLDASEVAACMWLPVSSLLLGSRARVAHVSFVSLQRLGLLGRLPEPLLRALGMQRARHIAVDVFESCSEIVYAEGAVENSGLGGREIALPVLWGLSFRAASDLVTICGGKSHVEAWPAYVFDNRLLALAHCGIHRLFVLCGQHFAVLGIGLPRRR